MSNYLPFQKAIPVWLKGLQREMNITCCLYTAVAARTGNTYRFSMATSGYYRVFVNGCFAFCGPARCAYGFYRVDEVDLAPFLKDGCNHIAVEAVSYYLNSANSLRQPGFIQVEIREGDTVLAATRQQGGGFVPFRLNERLQKVQRFSFQRTIGECYRLDAGSYAWRIGGFSGKSEAELEETDKKALVARNIPMGTFPTSSPVMVTYRGRVRTGIKPETYRKDRSLIHIGKSLQGFHEDELEIHISDEVQELAYEDKVRINCPYSGEIHLNPLTYEVVSLPMEKSGLIGAEITCLQDGVLYLMVDEILTEGDVDPHRLESVNIIKFEMKAGTVPFLSFEPFGFMYLKAVCISGEFVLRNIHVRELDCPVPRRASYTGSNPRLALIYEAAWETFRQNTYDIFMDCPTRERAGTLCDSFFLARSEKLFTGENRIEKNFLQNYLLPDHFNDIPAGMLPMCYPAEYLEGLFIPNWAMWFVIELADYQKRTGDREFVACFRERIYALLSYFLPFENELGLLEKLKGGVFVEWSRANDFVQDVNYPTNMLYSAMLKCVGQLYDDSKLLQKAEAIADTIRRRSFDGTYFVDNELRKDGALVSSGERTETCQYYAFFFDIAAPDSYPELWQRLLTEFGPDRQKTGLHPDIYPSSAFIGIYLRLDILNRHGRHEQCLQEIEGYFGHMPEKTGTLWEHITDYASCNHGFASYAAYLIENGCSM